MTYREQPQNPALAAVRIGEDPRELTRGEAILKGALAVGAVYGLAAIGPFARRALAATGNRELEILNFLLPFEYMQAELYRRGKSEINDKGERMVLKPEWKKLVSTLLDEELQHIDALTEKVKELGGKPAKVNPFAFAFRFVETFWTIAGDVEKASIRIYNYLIPEIKSKELQELASSIVQVEGRHVATVRIQVPEEPAPEAFDDDFPEYQALSSVLRFTGTYSLGLY